MSLSDDVLVREDEKGMVVITKQAPPGEEFDVFAGVFNRIDAKGHAEVYSIGNLSMLSVGHEELSPEDMKGVSLCLASNFIVPMAKTIARQAGISLEQLLDDAIATINETKCVGRVDPTIEDDDD